MSRPIRALDHATRRETLRSLHRRGASSAVHQQVVMILADTESDDEWLRK